jgi:hypothetical protein
MEIRHSNFRHIGYVLAIDMTARNVQDEAKRKGLPWSIAKGFDTFMPISNFIAKNRIPDPQKAHLWLSVNNEMKQSDNTELMLFRIPRQLSDISRVMTLEKGDIVLTGTEGRWSSEDRRYYARRAQSGWQGYRRGKLGSAGRGSRRFIRIQRDIEPVLQRETTNEFSLSPTGTRTRHFPLSLVLSQWNCDSCWNHLCQRLACFGQLYCVYSKA